MNSIRLFGVRDAILQAEQKMAVEEQRQGDGLIWAIFYPFLPRGGPKNQNFQKAKKKSGDITILH